MRRFSRILFASLAVILSGCAGTNTNTTSVPPSYPTLTGNWELTLGPPAYDAGAYLTNTNGSVSGIIYLYDMPCYLTADLHWIPIPVTGTMSLSGVLSVTSSTVAGQVLSLSGTVVSGTMATSGIVEGKYSITGGCANGYGGTASGSTVLPYSNTYNGSFGPDLEPGSPFTATIITTQTGPDAEGLFHVTGTATFTGNPCMTSGTITSSTISGTSFVATITDTAGNQIIFGGDLTYGYILGSYEMWGPSCPVSTGSDRLSVVAEP